MPLHVKIIWFISIFVLVRVKKEKLVAQCLGRENIFLLKWITGPSMICIIAFIMGDDKHIHLTKIRARSEKIC